MGYETRMYVCTPYCGGQDTLIQIEGHKSAYTVYNDNGKKADYFFEADGNTKRYVSSLRRKQVAYKIVKAQTVRVVAMVDLCKASYGEMEEVINKGHLKNGERGGFYDDGGNAIIVEDRYGDPMTFVDPKEVLAAMQKSEAREVYRRFTMAIAVLEAAVKGFPGERLQVLFFGY